MTKLWHVTLNDLRVTFNEKGIWVNLVVIPIVLIFIIGLVNGGAGGGGGRVVVRVDVFDNDNSPLAARFLDELRAVNETLVLCPMDNDEDDICQLSGAELTLEAAQSRLENNQVRAIVSIPAGFAGDILAGEPVAIEYRSQDDPTQPGPVLQSVQAVTQRTGAAAVAARVALSVYENSGVPFRFSSDTDRENFQQAVYDRASAIWDSLPQTVTYTQTIAQDNTTSGFSQSVPGMGTMYVMFTVLAGTFILLRERKQWTLQRLIMMPVTPGQVIGGKMLARFIMGMIQYSVAFGFGILVLRVPLGNNPAALVLVMAAFATCMTALAFLLATVVRSEMQANSMITLIALTLAPLGGAWWPLEIVPEWMRTVGHISPVAWAMDGFNTIIYRSGGVGDVLLPVAVLLGAALVMFFIAVRRFRYD